MALTLKLNELFLFEEKAGIPWKKALPTLARSECQMHRLQFAGCMECIKGAGKLCPDHLAAWLVCDGGCKPGEPSDHTLAALGWLMRRRSDSACTWDTYIAEAGEDEAWADVGNALAVKETPAE